MAGTCKAVVVRFEGAAKMGAGQAQGGESAFGVDEKRGYFWNGCARADRVIIHGAEVKFRFLFKGWGIREEAQQAASGERGTQIKKAITGKF